MKFRVEVICLHEDGAEDRCDVIALEKHELAIETLGLTLAQGKAILGGVQDFMTARQVAEHLQRRRTCPGCGQRYHSKSRATSTIHTLFGPVAVANPRWDRCSCQTVGPKTFRPTSAWLTGRTSPELFYLKTKWASLIPFARVADLLKEVLPVGASTNHETVREHLQGTAERIEEELGEERQPNRSQQIKDCIHDSTQVSRAGPYAVANCQQERFDQFPCRIRQVCIVAPVQQ